MFASKRVEVPINLVDLLQAENLYLYGRCGTSNCGIQSEELRFRTLPKPTLVGARVSDKGIVAWDGVSAPVPSRWRSHSGTESL